MAMVQPENFAKVNDGSFDIFCKELKEKITVDREVTNCPHCGALLTNVGFALVE